MQERLERDYGLDLIATSPSVVFRVVRTDGSDAHDRQSFEASAAQHRFASIEEPYVKATIISPPDYVGAIMEITQSRRGTLGNMEYLHDGRVILTYEMPLIEVIVDFFDALKSRTKGYASLDYEVIGYREGDLAEARDSAQRRAGRRALVHRGARQSGRSAGARLTEKLKELIPRQMFEVPIQAAIGGKIVARETVSAMRKNVLSKCYGGDITRKRKLLEKQKAGKERMKRVGRVELPQEAFMAVLAARVRENLRRDAQRREAARAQGALCALGASDRNAAQARRARSGGRRRTRMRATRSSKRRRSRRTCASVQSPRRVLADDSGLEVDALDGRPGVLSARYGGREIDWPARRAALLAELRGVPPYRRTARFVCALVLIEPHGEPITATGEVDGYILEAESGTGGFGYDPLFLYPPVAAASRRSARRRRTRSAIGVAPPTRCWRCCAIVADVSWFAPTRGRRRRNRAATGPIRDAAPSTLHLATLRRTARGSRATRATVVGIAIAHASRRNGTSAISYVEPSFRGQGFGRRLLRGR